MKLLLAGDTHGNSSHMQNVFAYACRVEADAVFQLGDFGFGWGTSQRKGTGEHYDTFTDHVSKFAAIAKMPCYWLPGNHENYWALAALLARLEPESNGTFQIASGVFYVARGTKLTFGDKTFLCCGGATSVDRDYRKPGASWWPEEAITEEDVLACENAGQADVLLSHDFPWECDVVDRHLSPWWGERAQVDTVASRQKISEILDACGAMWMAHGHLHKKYDELITTASGRDVWVHGLDCDQTPMSESTYLLDTEEL